MDEPAPIICPGCGEPAVETLHWPVTTLMSWPYTDPVGRRHFHDLNNPATTYRCVEGHEFCPPRCWCGWGETVYDRDAERARRVEAIGLLAHGLDLDEETTAMLLDHAEHGRATPILYGTSAFGIAYQQSTPPEPVDGPTDPVMLSGPAVDELDWRFPALACPALVPHGPHNWAPFPPPGQDRDAWSYCEGRT